MRPAALVRALNLPAWIVVAAAVAAWWLVAAAADLDSLSAPKDVGVELVRLLTSGEVFDPLAHTLVVTIVASGIACGIGLAVGLALGLVPLMRRYSMASVDVLRTLPVIGLMPVALLIWGPSPRTEIIVASYAATWPMLVNTVGGVAGVDAGLKDVATMFGFSRWKSIRKVTLPAAGPSLLIGARLSIVVALVVAVVAEMLVNLDGLGWELLRAQQGLQPDRMWAYVVVTGILGYVLNLALVAVVNRGLMRGGPGLPAGQGRS